MQNSNLLSLLDLREKTKGDISQEFSIIAAKLFNNYEIVKNRERYRLLEIEFTIVRSGIEIHHLHTKEYVSRVGSFIIAELISLFAAMIRNTEEY